MRVRYTVPNYEFLRKSVLELSDDPALAWDAFPCLLWPRGLYKDGYGMFKLRRHRLPCRAHVAAWRLVRGRIPRGKMVLHRCNHPACYRPSHLFVGNHKQKLRYCIAMGRYVNAAKQHPERMRRGSEHGLAKLTEDLVRQIRSLYVPRAMSQSMLARKFGVSQTLIGFIVRKEIWRHV